MDYIKQWTISVCITLIIAVILSFVSPNGTMGRFYKTIISLFIAAAFLVPLADFKIKDFDLSPEAFAQAEEYDESYEKQIETLVKSGLEEGGYPACSVTAQVRIKDDEIIIDKLQVAAPTGYNLQEIKTYIYDNLGFNAEVYSIGD